MEKDMYSNLKEQKKAAAAELPLATGPGADHHPAPPMVTSVTEALDSAMETIKAVIAQEEKNRRGGGDLERGAEDAL